MDLQKKQNLLSRILRIAKAEYRKKKEKTESAADSERALNVLKKLNDE